MITYAVCEHRRRRRGCLACGPQAVRVCRAPCVLPESRCCELKTLGRAPAWRDAERTFRNGHPNQAFALLRTIRAERFVEIAVVLPCAVHLVRCSRTDVGWEKLSERDLADMSVSKEQCSCGDIWLTIPL